MRARCAACPAAATARTTAHLLAGRLRTHPAPPILLQAAACGLPHDTPLLQVLVDEAVHHKGEEPSTGGTVYPLPRPLSRVVHFSTMPIGHLNYAVGWGCMSAAMGYMALGAARKAARRGR